jgi:23S rRNA (adenine2503-C2)-methyltransferase
VDRTRPLLRDLAPADLEALIAAAGEPRYRADQLRTWIHAGGALDWAAMSNLPLRLREALAAEYDLAALAPVARRIAADGTRKYLFFLRDKETVESVVIPMEAHATFCLSSQVGCRMACRFCATARGGLVRDLSAGEILEQVLRLRADLAAEPVPGHGGRHFNLVFMGMGEPLDNWAEVSRAIATMIAPEGLGISPRRIQISTSGVEEGLLALLDFPHPVGLTLSIGCADEQKRRRLMPVSARTPLSRLVELAAAHARRAKRRATLAYVMIEGANDSLAEARLLADLARGGPFKVNLIPLNLLDGDSLRPTPRPAVERFQDVLVRAGIRTHIRASGGQDIAAACGQLRRRHRQGTEEGSR